MADNLNDKESDIVEANVVSSLTPKIPPFWPHEPDLWFIQIEALFRRHRITGQQARADYILSAISPQTMQQVRDIVANPSTTNPYDTLKDAMLTRLGLSTKEKFRELFSKMELGDQKPSQLLSRMRALIGNHQFDETALKELWERLLPKHIQLALAAVSDTNLDNLANLADQIHAVSQSHATVASVAPLPQAPSPPQPDVTNALLQYMQRTDSTIAALNQQLVTLTAELSQIQLGSNTHADRSRSRNRAFDNRSRSRGRTPSNGFCWYHNQFGHQAQKCVPPCSFFNKDAPRSGN